ncbi:MAG: 50S ribosomal protein L9 [Saprospiraceae bacterium]|nr:50S ribosomal protein L9 [Saprospiraceae bacterium]
MDIILLRDIDKVGDKHTIVNVKDGYGRNYLIPKGYAVIANETNRGKLDEIKAKEEAELQARIDEFKQIADQINGKSIKIGAKAGQSDKIFGSVTNVQIASAIQEQLNVEVERRRIEMPEEIKELGTYQATIQLHPDVTATIDFEVVAE